MPDYNIKKLDIRKRYALSIELSKVFGDTEPGLESLARPEVRELVDKLIALTDVQESVFDDDLSMQLTVAFAVVAHNLEGLLTATPRMMLTQTSNAYVRKLMRKEAHPDQDKIGPDIKEYWFLWRPVLAETCTYREMFIDEIYSFGDIHEIHQMLDVKQFLELSAMDNT